jgi:periplasmic protein TonB
MTFPSPPQPAAPPPPPPHWPPPPPSAAPVARQSSKLVPLLVVGAIAAVTLMAGAAAAVMLVMMNRSAATSAPTPPDGPPPELAFVEPSAQSAAPATSAPETPVAEPDRAADPPEAPSGPQAPVERARRTAAIEEREAARPGAKLGSRLGGFAEAPPPPPPPMAIRAGGTIPAPRKLRNVQPVYPQIAQSARVQGAVIIEATIDPGGHISETRVLRSIPLLDEAALDAVRQWEYEPTLLNGVAVPVIVTVTVNFALRP